MDERLYALDVTFSRSVTHQIVSRSESEKNVPLIIREEAILAFFRDELDDDQLEEYIEVALAMEDEDAEKPL